MTNRKLYKSLIVLISLLMIFNQTSYVLSAGESVATTLISWEDKVEPYLLTKMQETMDEKIPVWLWMEDINQTTVEQIVYERTGLRENNLSVVDEPLDNELAVSLASLSEADEETAVQVRAEFQSYLNRTERERIIESQRVDTYLQELRSVQKEMHQEQNANIFALLNIPEEDIINSNTQAPVYIVYIEKNDIERLAKHPKVTGIYYYEEVTELQAQTTLFETVSGSSVVRVRSDIGLTGSGVTIGILDNGKVKPDTEIISSRITYGSHTNNAYELHATNVAKTAAGSNGVATAANIYSASGSLETLIGELADNGITLANRSMVVTGDRSATPYTGYEIYTDYMVQTKRVTVVCAAGNNAGVIPSPALAYNVITVGGFFNQGTSDQRDDQMYANSNYNHLTGCYKPDLVADQTWFYNDETSAWSTGTSYAAPFVTGTIALLFELRPSLQVFPEAVKAILMASCHRKVLPADGDSTELMSSGMTNHQGAGAIDPYMAVAIAGSGHYSTRTMGSTSTEETIRFDQLAYGSSGLNVSLAWLRVNTSTSVAGSAIDLDLILRQDDGYLSGSSLATSSTEMVYITPSSDASDYEITVDRYSATGTAVRYAYAFSVSDTRYQYTDENEGVFFIRNKANDLYLTRSGTTAYQMSFTGSDVQKWLIHGETIYSASTANNRLNLGTTISGIYRKVVTDTSEGIAITIQPSSEGTELNGTFFIYNEDTGFALGAYNNSSTNGSYAAWSAYSASNTYQQWYLEPVAYQRGDVDRDGDIDASDGLLALQYSVQSVTLSDLQQYLADVNGDGAINSTDSLIINQISTGVIL